MTPGEEIDLANRDNSIRNEAQALREANGGRLNAAERQQRPPGKSVSAHGNFIVPSVRESCRACHSSTP